MKTKPNDHDILKAYDWYEQHNSNIDVEMLLTGDSYPPSGSDCRQPALWKPGHWKWLLSMQGEKILAKEIRRLKYLLTTLHDNTDPDRFANIEWWNDIITAVNDGE